MNPLNSTTGYLLKMKLASSTLKDKKFFTDRLICLLRRAPSAINSSKTANSLAFYKEWTVIKICALSQMLKKFLGEMMTQKKRILRIKAYLLAVEQSKNFGIYTRVRGSSRTLIEKLICVQILDLLTSRLVKSRIAFQGQIF